jgi:hypothetical protein
LQITVGKEETADAKNHTKIKKKTIVDKLRRNKTGPGRSKRNTSTTQ